VWVGACVFRDLLAERTSARIPDYPASPLPAEKCHLQDSPLWKPMPMVLVFVGFKVSLAGGFFIFWRGLGRASRVQIASSVPFKIVTPQ
jgi:hypothetical protein